MRTAPGRRSADLSTRPLDHDGPLVVLGVLTVVGGVISLPTFVGGHHWLESAGPVTAAAAAFARWSCRGSTELLLVGGAVLVGVVGLALGTG